MRRSVFNELLKIIIGWSVQHLFSVNKSDAVITCNNGYQILFVGLDDVEKIKSITPAKGVITDIWIEEATETEIGSVKQLYKRQRGGDPNTPKRLVMTFNPILQSHWIYNHHFAAVAWDDAQTVHEDDGLLILKTTYKDNAHLTPDDVADLENERDDYYRNVYTLGNWGVLGDIIFTNWEVQDLSEKRHMFINHRHGLDFGFSSDPAAAIFTHYDRMRRTIYIYDEVYERGLTNNLLANAIRQSVAESDIICDSAEPKSITELQGYNIRAVPARKGKDSVTHGIQWLQQQRIIIDRNCINTRNEFQQYQWRKDKDGNALRQPVDKNDHLIDALRYAYENDSAGGISAGASNYV